MPHFGVTHRNESGTVWRIDHREALSSEGSPRLLCDGPVRSRGRSRTRSRGRCRGLGCDSVSADFASRRSATELRAPDRRGRRPPDRWAGRSRGRCMGLGSRRPAGRRRNRVDLRHRRRTDGALASRPGRRQRQLPRRRVDGRRRLRPARRDSTPRRGPRPAPARPARRGLAVAIPPRAQIERRRPGLHLRDPGLLRRTGRLGGASAGGRSADRARAAGQPPALERHSPAAGGSSALALLGLGLLLRDARSAEQAAAAREAARRPGKQPGAGSSPPSG